MNRAARRWSTTRPAPSTALASLLVLAAACGQPADAAGRLPEPWSGGHATVFLADANAFQNLAPNILSYERLQRYRRGLALFHVEWQPPPAANFGGLGPRFNHTSCAGCHRRHGRSKPPGDAVADSDALVIRLALAEPDATGAPRGLPVYGRQLNDRAIGDATPEGQVAVRWREQPGTFADGEAFSLRAPEYEFTWRLGEPPAHHVAARTAPAVIGMGLLAAIPDAAIERLADEHDRDGDGISGRVQRVPDGATLAVGRFGWKAGEATLDAQVHAAFHEDVGITSVASLRRFGGAPGEVPELSADDSLAIVLTMQLGAVPARRDTRSPDVLRGERLFGRLGCVACHVAHAETGDVAGHPEVSRQTIRPYTDLLLHDLGAGLAESGTEHRAGPREWRTAPLWGLGLIVVVNGHEHLLHDGRARGIVEAVLWHGGEAEASRERFRALPRDERRALLAFLRSL